ITRCGQTYEQDDVTTGVTLTAEDRFCLDGQRLIQTAGNEYGEPDSQYRLEIDSFLRITAKGNAGGFPQYFVVEGKDVSSSVFGSANGSGSSSVKISDSSSAAIYAWPIDRFEDSAGNYIESLLSHKLSKQHQGLLRAWWFGLGRARIKQLHHGSSFKQI